MKIGITGHQRLEDPGDWEWVISEINHILTSVSKPFVGVSSLAIGADQVFANAVLKCGEKLIAIIPFVGYELTFSEGYERQQYLLLLNQAMTVDILPKMDSEQESYFAAGKKVVDTVELLIAVWNGKPAKGLGGTADVVNYAVRSRKNTIHLNPISHIVSNIFF
ncbi:MAG: hypothetical protein QNJ63_24405 [Calothrix sp. MO_192.B10]|nr:hypothetical protein [Calothrix sp. MO_192.B10]